VHATVRCPNPECAAVFDIAVERLGRNVYCVACGRRMSAKRHDVESALRARSASAGSGSDGWATRRLPIEALLDDVRSLWNVGSMFRSADACAVARLLLCGITGTPPRREIAKTALGADEVVAWTYHADAAEALDDAIARGLTPVALESTPRAVALAEIVWPARTLLVVGNEVDGVSPRLLDRCGLYAAIPMRGAKESLNVAVAFGIAAYVAATALAARSAHG